MPKNKPPREEVQTTLRLDKKLHLWLRQYALTHETTLMAVVENVLLAWAEEQGYTKPEVTSATPQSDEKDES